jgi:phosphonate transport system ATP-binding protein
VIYDGDPKLSNKKLEEIYGEELGQLDQYEYNQPSSSVDAEIRLL